MKNIVDFITESKYFKLSESERDSLKWLVGFLTGAVGDDAEIKQYAEYWKVLSDEEKNQMNDLYDTLDDEYTFPTINRNMIKDDLELIHNFLNWVDENDLWGDYEYEGPSIIEKIEGKYLN